MTKTKYIFIISITMILFVAWVGLYEFILAMINSFAEAFTINASSQMVIFQQLYPYILYTIALVCIVVYVRYFSDWVGGFCRHELITYVCLMAMAFTSIRVVEFPFCGIKLFVMGLFLNESVIGQTTLLAEYLLSFMLIIPFIISYIIISKRYTMWYLQKLELEKIVFAYIVIHGMFITYTFSGIQNFMSKLISDDVQVTRFLWIESLHVASITLVTGAIMLVVLNGLRANYLKETGRPLKFSSYKGYLGITLVFAFMYSLFALPNLFQVTYDAIASGDRLYMEFIFQKKLVEVGIPLMAVLLGFVWIKQDPIDFLEPTDVE